MDLPLDEKKLLERYRAIKRTGWGKLEVVIQTISGDNLKVLFSGGGAEQFIVKNGVIDD